MSISIKLILWILGILFYLVMITVAYSISDMFVRGYLLLILNFFILTSTLSIFVKGYIFLLNGRKDILYRMRYSEFI